MAASGRSARGSVLMTSWDRSMSDYERESLIGSLALIVVWELVSALASALVWKRLSGSQTKGLFFFNYNRLIRLDIRNDVFLPTGPDDLQTQGLSFFRRA